MPKKRQPANNPANDPLGGLLGGLLGGGPSSQGQTQPADVLGGLLGGLLGGGQSGAPSPQGGGGDALGGILGGLLGGGQQGLAPSGGNLSNNSLLGPIIDSIAAKFGVSPQIAGAVVTIALTYLTGSAGGAAAQKVRKGKVSRKFLQDNGLVSQLQEQTGMDSDTAAASLSHVFQALSAQMAGG